MPLLSFQQKFVDQVDLALDEIRAGGNSVGIALVGPSGSGKTHGIDVIAARFLATGEGRDRTIPLIRTTAASLNGSPAMARSILKLHGVRPEIVKKTIDVEAAANHSIEMRSTDIFVFEEMGDALTKGDKKLKAGAASALKWIWNAAPDESDNWTRMSGALARRGRIIVVSGTEAMEEELHRDPELENRFETVSTSYLDLRKTGDAESFRDVAIDIGRRCGLPDSSMGGRDGRLFVALYLATAADLRKVEKLLNRADKLRKRNPQMPMHQLLDLAFQQTQSSATVAQGLFSMPTKELSARYDAFRRAPRTPSKGKQVRKS